MTMHRTNTVRVVDVTLRDGIQSETRRIPSLQRKTAFGLDLLQAGLRDIEIGSFVKYDRFPALADTATLFQALQPEAQRLGARLSTLIFNERGLESAFSAGIEYLAVVVGVDPVFEQKNAGRTPHESLTALRSLVTRARQRGCSVRGYVSTCYTTSAGAPILPADVLTVARALRDMGCHELSLGDTAATATPEHVESLLGALLAGGLSADQLAMHFHVAPQQLQRAFDNLDAAFDHGIHVIDTSCAGIGGCPSLPEKAKGNLDTEAAVRWMAQHDFSHGCDVAKIARCANTVRNWFAQA